MFDHVVAYQDPWAENEILIYHIASCLYLTLKAENRTYGLTFETYLVHCSKLKAYVMLEKQLLPPEMASEGCRWTDIIYPKLERLYLFDILKFKTELVSTAEALFQIVCTFSEVNESAAHRPFGRLLEEALFLSYICLMGKLANSYCSLLCKCWSWHTHVKLARLFLQDMQAPKKQSFTLTTYKTSLPMPNTRYFLSPADFKPADYSTATLAIACLKASLDQASDTVKSAFIDYLSALQSRFSLSEVSCADLKLGYRDPICLFL